MSPALKTNLRDYLEDDTLDLSLLQMVEIPVKDIVSPPMSFALFTQNFLFLDRPLYLKQSL